MAYDMTQTFDGTQWDAYMTPGGPFSLGPPATQAYTGTQQLAGGKAAYMSPDTVPITMVGISNGLVVYLSFADGHYTRMFRTDGQSKYMEYDVTTTFDGTQWDTFLTPGGPFSLV
jgi:hypothetical protein